MLPRLPKLLDYQAEASAFLASRRRGLVWSPAGSGKTVIVADALAAVVMRKPRAQKVRLGWIANTTDQCQQAKAALAMFPVLADTVEATICCPAGAPAKWEVDVMVVDECFPAGTLIDGRPIESIARGEYVSAYNHQTNQVESARVRVPMKRQYSGSWYRIATTGGRSLVCTENHPIYTACGYLPAKHISIGDLLRVLPESNARQKPSKNGLCVQVLQASVRRGGEEGTGGRIAVAGTEVLSVRETCNLQEPQSSTLRGDAGEGLLLRRVPGRVYEPAQLGDDEGDKPAPSEDCRSADAACQSDAEPGDEGKDDEGHEGAHLPRQGRQRATDQASDRSVRGNGIADGVCDSDRGSARTVPESPESLQGGFSRPERETGDRSGRQDPQAPEVEVSRSQEDRRTQFDWVDRVEVYERGGRCRPHWVPSDDRVYNLHIETHHNYFANGVLVHNCHHAPARTWFALMKEHQGALWMVTATPFSEDEERNQILRELVDDQIHRVPREAVAARVLPAHVYLLTDTDGNLREGIDLEIEKTIQKRRRYGTRSGAPESMDEIYRQVASYVCIERGVVQNVARNAAIVRTARTHDTDSVLILVPKIEHGQELSAAIPGSAMAFSKMGAKKRRDTIANFRNGELRCLVATSLADEGLDVPCASVLIMAGAGRSKARVEQRTGRVLRAHGDKTHGIVYDFEDHQHPLLHNQSVARQSVYRKLGYVVHGGGFT